MALFRKHFSNCISAYRYMNHERGISPHFCCRLHTNYLLNSLSHSFSTTNINFTNSRKTCNVSINCQTSKTNSHSINYSTSHIMFDQKVMNKHSIPTSLMQNNNSLLSPVHSKPSFVVRCQHLVPCKPQFVKTTMFRKLHTSSSSSSSDVPDYLVGVITEIECSDDEIDVDATVLEMEEEIMEFLTCRAIQYDEADSSFIVECPNCSSSCEGAAPHRKDIFIDKQSGYYVCPWCCSAGTWEELCQVLDSKQDSLSVADLHSFLHSTLPLSDEFLASLKTSPCKRLSESVLRRYGCRSSEDGSHLVVPVCWPVGGAVPGSERATSFEPVGYFSISLLKEAPQIVSRFVKNRLCAWSSLVVPCSPATVPTSPPPTEMVVVSSMLDALHLAQLDVPCAVMGGGSQDWDGAGAPLPLRQAPAGPANVWGLPHSVRSVLVWLERGAVMPFSFYKFVTDALIECNIVSSWNETPLHQLQKQEIEARLLRRERLRLNGSVLPVADLHHQVYHRLTHPCQVCGVPWRRFPDLQRLLLGHRPGEVTVVSGPTGAGKTTLVAEYSLDLVQQGVPTLWASLEVSKERLCEVLLQQYSGAPLPSDRASFNTLWHAFKQMPLYFLDVHGQQPLELIMEAVRESALVRGVRHVVVDNLQFMVGCQSSAGERWQHQDMAMAAFRSFATQYNCHVTLIVHPRKLQAGEMLTLQTIGGGARVTQEADNVMLLQVQGANPVSCRKAIEVVKNRFGGHLGVVPIKFQPESLTFSGFFRRAKDLPKKKD